MWASLASGSWREVGIGNVVKSLGFTHFLSKSEETHAVFIHFQSPGDTGLPMTAQFVPEWHSKSIEKHDVFLSFLMKVVISLAISAFFKSQPVIDIPRCMFLSRTSAAECKQKLRRRFSAPWAFSKMLKNICFL